MDLARGEVSYKKQNGILAISHDRTSISWNSTESGSSASPALVIHADKITNLQQTPETSAKVMLRVFVQESVQPESVSYVFTFTSKTEARNQANNLKASLTTIIQARKATHSATTAGGGQSAAMAIAGVIAGAAKTGNAWEDDEKLKSDVRLQQSLMKEDPTLQKTFMEALNMKPDSISATQFTAQFWSSRVPQLRAHAIAQSQDRGNYNVFSELKREEGGRKMNLTQEHVRVIFEQYPVMRTIYDEVVPAKIKDESDFWSRFFQSQLFMVLRGLKFDRNKEAKDSMLDRYLEHPQLTGARATLSEMHIPKFIDLEGNEENNSQRKGNRPDFELRQNTLEKAPIIRRLNALSEKIMASVKPSDADASAPIGMDEATYEQLRLRDLAGDPEQNRIILNIRDQSRFFTESDTAAEGVVDQAHYIDPAKAILLVRDGLSNTFAEPGEGTIPIEDYESEDEGDADDDDEDTQNGAPRSGSSMATAHVMSLIQANREQTAPINPSSGLSSSIYERITLTHATTLEFLRQFWNGFLSGDPARANEVISLEESLKKVAERVKVIANDAEKERLDIIKSEQQRANEIFQKTGRRKVVDVKAIGGGEEVVRQLLAPLIKSVQTAQARFKQAYDEQIRDLEGAVQ